MGPASILFFVMTALVFAMWAFSMFSTVFAIRRRAAERTGKSLPGPKDTVEEWRIWFREPAYKQERRRLLSMTIVVMCLAFLASFSGGGDG